MPLSAATGVGRGRDGDLVARQVDGTTVARYAAGGLYEVNAATGATKTSYRFGDRLVAVRDGATGLHYLHQDHLGSTSLQTSPSGAIKGSQFRGPFGQPWVASGSLATDFQYTGQRSFESGVGGVAGAAGGLGSLVDYGSRWYSPVLGRFLQPDSIVPGAGNPQHLNRYSYVGNNPLRYTDPTGHYALLDDVTYWFPWNDNVITGTSNTVQGWGNSVLGSGNDVLGSGNDIGGNGNLVRGDDNGIVGSDNVVGGIGNSIIGSGNAIFGDDNIVDGSNNQLHDDFTYVLGSRPSISTGPNLSDPTRWLPNNDCFMQGKAIAACTAFPVQQEVEVPVVTPAGIRVVRVSVLHMPGRDPGGDSGRSGRGDPQAVSRGNLKRLPDSWLDEETAAEIKRGYGGSKANLYYDPRTGDIYAVQRGGAPVSTGDNLRDLTTDLAGR